MLILTWLTTVLPRLSSSRHDCLAHATIAKFNCCNVNLDTRHNQIAWSRLQTNSFLSLTQSFCFTIKMILRGRHNQVSDTFKCYCVTDWDALHFLLDI